ncbi:putative RING-H2 finger protein ATL21B [Impatiens glandulifera]|uniref:putative RING-H2 finger protein ATL21B n=1 Tax=Impatiens glandulifera TaxID=253017 RepID=UPI001FB1107F|nr:putative RING-H2 finger protein ATL21B [Impatiens glandulifera]
MAFFNLFISLFVFNVTILILPIYAKKSCKSSNCINDSLQIRFPFLLKGQQDENCGYPGFNLTCNIQGLPAIDLPFSGSPFMGNYFNSKEYFLKSCPLGFNSSLSYIVNCLSNSTNTIIVVKAEYAKSYIFGSCVEITVFYVPFPGEYRFQSYNYKFDYLLLTWNKPRCGYCEMDGGVCGLTSNVGSQDVECFYPKPVSHVLKILLMSFSIPAIIVFVVLACYKFHNNSQNINNSVHIRLDSITTPPHFSTTTGGGLDDSTIESYPIVIIGESNVSPGLNNKTCSICLSEFLAKETVRFIPNCTHCFHSDCIDKWLRLNHSCPVCRTSLTHVDVPSINV